MITTVFTTLYSYTDVTTILLFTVIAYLTWRFFQSRNLPPGPCGLPIAGYIPFMGTKPMEETFNKLSKKYGDVMCLYFGSKRFIVLNSYDAIKEAYVKQGANFAGRTPDFNPLDDTRTGLMGAEGERWKDHRRFILSTFRDYGMGKLTLEPRVLEEVHFYLQELANEKGKPFNVAEVLGMSTQNVISSLIFGKRFDYKDEKFSKLRKLQKEFFDAFPLFPVQAFFPFINYLPFADAITHRKILQKCFDAIMEFIGVLVDEHKAEFQENSRKDVVDAYMTEREQVIKRDGVEGCFNADEINIVLFELYGAGAETVTSILRWSYVLVMIHPDIQEKIHEEIDNVIGLERSPSIGDRSQMPYTEAFILEVYRFGSITPVNLPHSNVEKAELKGFTIPKRSVIVTNLWAVHFDPNLWDTPELFKPERFINAEGKVKDPEYLMPFGIGKRACVGESLARMEVFLYFVGTMQRFKLQPPPGTTAKLDIDSKATRNPKPYELCAIQRKGYSVS